MSINVALVATTKRDARKRYDAGQYIAVAQDQYRDGHTGQAITRADVDGWSFDELAENSKDTRRPSCVFWYRPADDGSISAVSLAARATDTAEWYRARNDQHNAARWERVADGYRS